MNNEGRRVVVDRDKIPSPLNFQWNTEDPFGDAKGRDMLSTDPFMEDGNEGSLGDDEPGLRSDLLEDASNEVSSFSNTPKKSTGSQLLDNSSERSQERGPRKRTSTASSSTSAPSRRKKKPKGMPKRPLLAYNLFFQSQRVKILDASGGAGNRKVGFEELGRVIGKKWKSLNSTERKIYVKLAEKDNVRYRKEMDTYNEMKAKKHEEADKLLPLDFEGPSTLGPTGVAMRQQDVDAASFRSPSQPQSQQPKFLHVENNYGAAAVHSPPKTSYSEELARQSIPSVPAIQQVGLVGSYPPSIMELPQGQYRQPFIIDNGLQRVSGAIAASRAPIGGPQYPTSQPVPQHLPTIPNPNSFPVPPGMEMTLNQGGVDRKYRVQYTCYSMSKDAAQQYIESLTGASNNSSTGRSPPPPGNIQNQGSFQGSWGG